MLCASYVTALYAIMSRTEMTTKLSNQNEMRTMSEILESSKKKVCKKKHLKGKNVRNCDDSLISDYNVSDKQQKIPLPSRNVRHHHDVNSSRPTFDSKALVKKNTMQQSNLQPTKGHFRFRLKHTSKQQQTGKEKIMFTFETTWRWRCSSQQNTIFKPNTNGMGSFCCTNTCCGRQYTVRKPFSERGQNHSHTPSVIQGIRHHFVILKSLVTLFYSFVLICSNIKNTRDGATQISLVERMLFAFPSALSFLSLLFQ